MNTHLKPVVLNADECRFDGDWSCGSCTTIVGPVHFGNNVRIGGHTFIGKGVEVKPNITIGSHCHIKEDTIVSQDVPNRNVLFPDGRMVEKV